MRVSQWSKNGFVLLALIFARRLSDGTALGRTLIAFVAFCFASSAVYIINDLADRERDRSHPRKRLRPIASGELSLRGAAITLTICLCVAAGLVALLTFTAQPDIADPFHRWGGSQILFVLTMLSYVAINIAYSFWLKHLVIWDIFVIAAGFVLRALAGAFVIPVPISTWFYVCMTFLALFLALGADTTNRPSDYPSSEPAPLFSRAARPTHRDRRYSHATHLLPLYLPGGEQQSRSHVDDPGGALWNLPLPLLDVCSRRGRPA
jgi:4-hydroxybenzoate polyprenyltransferase